MSTVNLESYVKDLIENNNISELQPRSYIDIAHGFIENRTAYILSNSGIVYKCPPVMKQWAIEDVRHEVTTTINNIKQTNWYVDYDDKEDEWYEVCIFGKSKYNKNSLKIVVDMYYSDLNLYNQLNMFDEKSKNPFSKREKDEIFQSIH
tara:strand:- start:16 stop:462 length:447 start_codon:yes stop_codon:yes gene_type:complete